MAALEYDDPFSLLYDEHFDLEALLPSTDSSFELPNDLELMEIAPLSWDLTPLDQAMSAGQNQLSESSSDNDLVSITPQSSSQGSIDNLRRRSVGPKPGCPENSTNSSSKRKWENSIITFDANPDKQVIPRKRKAFGDPRRKEVAITRAVGACVQCKIRKGPVKPTLILFLMLNPLLMAS